MKFIKRLLAMVLCGTLIMVSEIPAWAADTPSSWAVGQVNAAVELKLVPQSLQLEYTKATTRAEFCALAVALYETVKDTTITDRKIFNDTNDINVEKAAAIGVVSGIGNDKFDPNAKLTREQAATMLARLAEAVGKPLPAQAATFADNVKIATWAIEQVGQIQAAGIMSGVGNNTFAPQDPYTREQSIITIVRTYEVVTGVVVTPPPAKTGLHYEFTNTQERLYESFGETRWETLIEITNTGTEVLYCGLSKYDLTDETGKLLKTGTLSTFPSILHPGEKGYFYGSESLSGVSVNGTVKFVPRWAINKSKENRINFDLSEIEIREGQFGTTVFGKISNNTGKKQNWAIISVVLYAKDGTPIGVWMTNVMEAMPIGAEFGFEISNIMKRTLFDNVTSDMVGSYKAYAYPPQYQF